MMKRLLGGWGIVGLLLAVVGCAPVVVSTATHRVVRTQLGELSFELPGPVANLRDDVSEHYRMQGATGAGTFGYGEYHFTVAGYKGLALQVVVKPGSNLARRDAESQLKEAVAMRMGVAGAGVTAELTPSGAIAGEEEWGGRKIPVIAVKDHYGRSVQVALPVRKGTVTLYLSSDLENDYDLAPMLGEILATVRVR